MNKIKIKNELKLLRHSKNKITHYNIEEIHKQKISEFENNPEKLTDYFYSNIDILSEYLNTHSEKSINAYLINIGLKYPEDANDYSYQVNEDYKFDNHSLENVYFTKKLYYKYENYFKKKLIEIQGKISPKKHRVIIDYITDKKKVYLLDKLNYTFVKNQMKIISFSNYSLIPMIIRIIDRTDIINLSELEEQEIIKKFNDFLDIYNKYKNDSEKIVNINYLLYQYLKDLIPKEILNDYLMNEHSDVYKLNELKYQTITISANPPGEFLNSIN